VTMLRAKKYNREAAAILMFGCSLAAIVAPAHAQTAQPTQSPAPAVAPVPVPPAVDKIVKTINVVGSQRIEPDTVRSYVKLRAGGKYSTETLDDALRDLLETELFTDVQIRDNSGDLVIEVRENPVINRILLEGNKRLKEEKIRPEIKLAPRQIFTRSKTRADVARIIELYQRQGRYAATVEPKMVMLDQNRVDIVFEISEGPKSKVRQINIIGNEKFKDKKLVGEMATKPSRFYRFFSSGDSYDPDKLAYDQSKLRQFYLTQGYADFRVVSAVAELTPDKRDFIVTYVVEEGDRYKFGDVTVDSELRDYKPNANAIVTKKGNWYNAKAVEDTVEQLTEAAGLFGYAFAEINPDFVRDKEARTMTLTYKISDAPRVYVERIDINGNTLTQDKVIRREFRLAEGDPFNSFQVKRSSDRIQSLGYFQEKLEIEQKPGSTPDRIILEANVEEKSTGELQFSAGFSSLERFIINFSIRQRNFRGKGQELRASVNYSSYGKSVELGFTEPYFMDRNIALGGDIFRRDQKSFNFNDQNRDTNYQQTSTGLQLRAGTPITEYWQFAARYGLSADNVTLPNRFLTNGICDPFLSGRYLCDAVGKRTTSSLGYTLFFSNLDNSVRPTRGQRFSLSQDFAGLGGSVKYLRTTVDARKYWKPFGNFVVSVTGEGGYVHPLNKQLFDPQGNPIEKVRLTDRFNLGEPQFPGFDIRGIGPRVLRRGLDAAGNIVTDRKQVTDDSLGGRAYYLGRLEMELPLGSGAKELGLRPSIFAVIGSNFGVRTPGLTKLSAFPTDAAGLPTALFRDILSSAGGKQCQDATTGAITSIPTTGCATGTNPYGVSIPPFDEVFLGDTWKPRVSVGIGVNWNSPFGPFRIDIAKALIKRDGDDPKLFTFNVGTQF
jgi:outer membrane protein insertion porin family